MEAAEQFNYSTEEIEALQRAFARQIGAARVDPKAFFEFVIKEETTRRAVRCLPHQRVLFDFVQFYDRSVIRMPVGATKTYSMGALTMWLLGLDHTQRGAVISATQEQAKKPLGMVRDYIETSPELGLVFPDLKPSSRSSDPWTQTQITVDRPAGIRDPSLKAVGVDGSLPGARLSWMLVDDILSDQNTNTPEQREHVHRWFKNTVLSRRDVENAKVVVTNTPWHPDDLTYRLEKAGWPSLTMDIDGGIYFENADDFDTGDIRPSDYSDDRRGEHRLTEHDSPAHTEGIYNIRLDDIDDEPSATVRAAHPPEDEAKELEVNAIGFDAEDLVPLWPEKFNRKHIAEIKETYAGALYEFNQLYMCLCRDDDNPEGAKVEWIDKCKDAARAQEFFYIQSEWDKPWPTFTGVDLAIGKKKKHDWTALLTFAVTPEGKRLIVDAEHGKWGAKTIVKKIIGKHERFGSLVVVESNAAQDYLRQWAVEEAATLPIRPFNTGKNKIDPHHGLKSMFIEIENTAWLIPSDHRSKSHPSVQMFCDDAINYDPDGHTGDMLMAGWFARELARREGFLRKGAVNAYLNRKRGGGSALSAIQNR